MYAGSKANESKNDLVLYLQRVESTGSLDFGLFLVQYIIHSTFIINARNHISRVEDYSSHGCTYIGPSRKDLLHNNQRKERFGGCSESQAYPNFNLIREGISFDLQILQNQ